MHACGHVRWEITYLGGPIQRSAVFGWQMPGCGLSIVYLGFVRLISFSFTGSTIHSFIHSFILSDFMIDFMIGIMIDVCIGQNDGHCVCLFCSAFD